MAWILTLPVGGFHSLMYFKQEHTYDVLSGIQLSDKLIDIEINHTDLKHQNKI